MWSEEIDKKIRSAAGNENYGYHDKNWQNMEVLLDKHLPQEKKRKWILFFLLLSVLLISGYFLYTRFSTEKKQVAGQKNIPATSAPEKLTSTPPVISPASKNITNPSENIGTTDRPQSDNHTTGKPVSVIPALRNINSIVTFRDNKHTSVTHNQSEKEGSLVEEADKNVKQTEQGDYQPDAIKSNKLVPGNVVDENSHPDLTASVTPPTINPDKNSSTGNIKTGTDITKTAAPAITALNSNNQDSSSMLTADGPLKKEKALKKRSSKFSLNFSFGPDVSSVGIDRPGKLRPQYGVGLGYAVSEKFSIRTGFYAGRKIYTADSTDYHANPWGPYSFKLYEVEGNCFVYEIPVSLMYSFKRSKNHNWFVSTGLSTYLMNSEDYLYNYKNPAGQTLSHRYNFKNENSHFFSVLNLSGGYQYHFNKRFSILAEPYIKMPLSGVGVGKVRLNGTGILFTASVKPFKL